MVWKGEGREGGGGCEIAAKAGFYDRVITGTE